MIMRITLCAFFVLFTLSAPAAVRLPDVIASHMVLQQKMAVPIWGFANPNEQVTVKFRDQQKTAVADAQGKWMVKLDPLEPGDPATLTVSGENTLTLEDVLVGEVWLGSGQSNMDTPVSMYAAEDAILNAAMSEPHPQLRLFHLIAKDGWNEATPDKVNKFSAQLFYFGVLLQKELNVPVGLMQSAQGGSPSFPFISQEAFDADPTIQPLLAKWDADHPLEIEQKKYEDAHEKWKTDIAAAIAANASNPPTASSSASAQIILPYDPSAPPAAATAPIDKAILAKYPEPKPPILATETKTGQIFEKQLRPLVPYAIRGVLWDQGESGTGVACLDQPTLMAALMRSWRQDWGQGDFPWIYVEKPSGRGCALNPDDPVNAGALPFAPLPSPFPPGFAVSVTEGYRISLFPNTFLTITSDLANGIHPINKSGYATRDSKVALGAVYGEPIEYYGPIFDSFKADGNQLVVSFTHVSQGLTTPPNQKLQGFAIAGEDKKWHWADAAIVGQTVVLSSPDVPNPVAARYWPTAWANLFNLDGLPALGFATDIH